ncbi:hypothetical protein [Haloglomus litoreum]|uniref:hypothetical protein n=1 Tax=Haloglomus litoreum TaxID=3034026 RepID=UPI0023E87D82|nr:hypothetical protein [Haloglomus sp. DT116]
MKRRTYLAAAGAAALAGLSGCKGAVAQGTGRHLLGPDTDERRVTLAEVDDVPDEHEVRMEVEMLETVANADHPPRLTVTTTNEGPEQAISGGSDMCHLFNRSRAGSDDPEGLWLYRADDADDIDRRGGRWVPDRTGRRAYAMYGCSRRLFAADESLTNEYEVWDDYRNRGYFPPGTYRWAERVEVLDDPRSDADTDPATFTWGFSLSVEVPE